MESIQEQEVYKKNAVEFIPLYEQLRLKQPMDLIGDFDNGTTHMNHYRFYYYGHYMDCYASTEKPLIEIGMRRVTEKLVYSEANFAAATTLCNDLNEGYHAGKVLCYPDYDKKIIYFDVWFQSLVPQMPEDMDYLVDGTEILAGVVMEEVDKLIDKHKQGGIIKE
jgi:hypothetical protein